MPKLPHSEPLTAELSGAVDSGAHAVDRRIGKTLSAYFLTEQAAFFILIALVKTLLFTRAIRKTASSASLVFLSCWIHYTPGGY